MNVSTTSTHTHAHRPAAQSERTPGSMTAVMRALPEKQGPKVLRVGLVQGGRVLEDRIMKDRSTVTIGASEAATFVVTTGSATPVKLFERSGADYVLHVRDGMRGRIALESGIVSLTGASQRLLLTEAARGKVIVGDTTFLFQFVAAPVPSSRPQLPLSIKGGLASQSDWSLTVIAAFSFLAHFGVVGGMYSDWMDPVVNTEVTANGLVDLASHLPSAPIEIPQPVDPSTPATTAPPSPVATTQPSATPVADTHVTPHSHVTSAAEVEHLSNLADAMGISAMTALGANTSSVSIAMNGRDIPMPDLGPAAGSDMGARAATGNELNFGAGGDIPHPSAHTGDLAQLANVHVGPQRHDHETDKGVPSGIVDLSPPITPTGNGADIGAARVVAGLRASFRACYNRGLGADPTMAGRVMLTAKVGPNGEVTSTSASDNVGLSATVVQCLLSKLGTAQFDGGHPATTVRIPAGFVQQGVR